MKKYVNISGFNVKHSNRGNAALSYGAISFLRQKGLLHTGQEIINFRFFRHPLRSLTIMNIKKK